MAPTDQPTHGEEEEDGEEYLKDDDVYIEVDQGDEPMDEDDDNAGGLGDEIVWEDNSIRHFTSHEGPVYAVAAHPNAPVAASGGGDDFGYIWDVTDGETIVKLTGHADSVTATAFSSDGEMVSTGGMDGRVRVWKRVRKDDYRTWEFLTELQGPDEVMVRPSAIRRYRHEGLLTKSSTVVALASQRTSITGWLQRQHSLAMATYETVSWSSPTKAHFVLQCRLAVLCKFLRATQGLFSVEILLQTVGEQHPIAKSCKRTCCVSQVNGS